MLLYFPSILAVIKDKCVTKTIAKNTANRPQKKVLKASFKYSQRTVKYWHIFIHYWHIMMLRLATITNHQ